MTLPATTYTLRFYHWNGQVEEFEHTDEDSTWAHFRLFGIGDADLYHRIDLVAYDWLTRTEHLLASNTLPA